MGKEGEGFRRIVEMFALESSVGAAGGSFKGDEAVGEGLEDARTESEEVEFSFTANGYEAGGFEFLDVVGERGGGDGQSGESLRTAERTAGFGDALEQFKAARIGKSFKDGCAASAG
jgi:hypothetical protein